MSEDASRIGASVRLTGTVASAEACRFSSKPPTSGESTLAAPANGEEGLRRRLREGTNHSQTPSGLLLVDRCVSQGRNALPVRLICSRHVHGCPGFSYARACCERSQSDAQYVPHQQADDSTQRSRERNLFNNRLLSPSYVIQSLSATSQYWDTVRAC